MSEQAQRLTGLMEHYRIDTTLTCRMTRHCGPWLSAHAFAGWTLWWTRSAAEVSAAPQLRNSEGESQCPAYGGRVLEIVTLT